MSLLYWIGGNVHYTEFTVWAIRVQVIPPYLPSLATGLYLFSLDYLLDLYRHWLGRSDISQRSWDFLVFMFQVKVSFLVVASRSNTWSQKLPFAPKSKTEELIRFSVLLHLFRSQWLIKLLLILHQHFLLMRHCKFILNWRRWWALTKGSVDNDIWGKLSSDTFFLKNVLSCWWEGHFETNLKKRKRLCTRSDWRHILVTAQRAQHQHQKVVGVWTSSRKDESSSSVSFHFSDAKLLCSSLLLLIWLVSKWLLLVDFHSADHKLSKQINRHTLTQCLFSMWIQEAGSLWRSAWRGWPLTVALTFDLLTPHFLQVLLVLKPKRPAVPLCEEVSVEESISWYNRDKTHYKCWTVTEWSDLLCKWHNGE